MALLHGLAGSARRTWGDNAWFDLLADAGREVIGVDLLGHGSAPKPHHVEGYADFEQHVTDHFPTEPIDAIGFSLGAYTLLSIASKTPERFHKLVVSGVGRNLFERDEDHSRMILHAVTGEPDPENPEALHFSTLADDPEADREALAALLSSRTAFNTDCLGDVAVPTLVVVGDKDFAYPADQLGRIPPRRPPGGPPGRRPLRHPQILRLHRRRPRVPRRPPLLAEGATGVVGRWAPGGRGGGCRR